MTTAKPHQAASQSDSADDLIAELAKLMAQDAQTDRPAASVAQAAPAPAAAPTPSLAATPTIRIPGVTPDTQPAAAQPVPRFDFAPAPSASSARQEPVAPTPAPQSPEPFRFDFDLHAGQRKQPEAPRPAEAKTEPQPQEQHDVIADLISELHEEPVFQPAGPAVAEEAAWIQPKPVEAVSVEPEFDPAPVSRREPDKFRVAPVFGLSPQSPNSEPAAPIDPTESRVAPSPFVAAVVEPEPVAAKPADPDPIDEIESLIGRAVRVELNSSARAAPRSLATPTLPQETLRETDAPAGSDADEAILAAAAATGVHVDWVNPVDAPRIDEPAPRAKLRRERPPRERRPGIARAFVGPLIAVALLLVAGFGLYWVLGLGRNDGPAPVLTADTTPIKEAPAAAPEPTEATQSVVFNEMEGVVPGEEEQLVSRDQADVNEVTREEVPPTVSDGGLVNRKVRTVTVRPDGTIVSGDQTLAGSSILPVDRPNVPPVPGAQTASPELMANAAGQPSAATPAGSLAPVTPAPQTAASATPPVVPGSTVPVVDASGNLVAGKIAPVPFERPTSIGNAPPSAPSSPVNAVLDPVAALIEPSAPAAQPSALPPVNPTPAPAAQPAAAPVVSGGNAPAYAQLASQRSEEDARATANALVSRFGSLFGGASPEIQRADLGERGVYYRVRVPASSRENAAQICTTVRGNGGDCVVM